MLNYGWFFAINVTHHLHSRSHHQHGRPFYYRLCVTSIRVRATRVYVWAQQLHKPKFAIGSRRIGPAEHSTETFSWVRTFWSRYLERSHGTFPWSNGTVKVCPLAYSTDPIWTFRPFRLLRRSLNILNCVTFLSQTWSQSDLSIRSKPEV